VIGNPNHRSQLTYNRAHAMLPALGKPLFIRIMERLYRIGIREYTIVAGENEGAVVSYLNSQWMPDVKVNVMVSFSTNSLNKVFREIAQKLKTPFVVCGYNSFTHTHFPDQLMRTHTEWPNALIFSGATTTLSQSTPHAYAVVDARRVTDVVREPTADRHTLTLNDLYVCGEDMVDYLAELPDAPSGVGNTRQFIDIVQSYIRSGGAGRVAESTWILQVEADRDLLILSKHLLEEGRDAHILSELPYTVKIIPPVRIDPQVSVGQGTRIGPYVYLERGCSVGHDVVLKETIVLTRALVPAERTMINTILTTRGPIP
jgi:NDP-sugar pyrophosphorylase family protein